MDDSVRRDTGYVSSGADRELSPPLLSVACRLPPVSDESSVHMPSPADVRREIRNLERLIHELSATENAGTGQLGDIS